MMTKTTYENCLKELEDVKFVSPYRLGVLMNVRPQMIYTYVKQHYITASKNDVDKLQITQKEAIRFVTKYYKRNSK